MISLTAKQLRVLHFIAGHIEAHDGISPSFQQIADMLRSSKSQASRQIKALEQAGTITRLNNRARSFRVNVPVTIPRTPNGEPLYFVEPR